MIGVKLKLLRTRDKINQQTLADALGVTKGAVAMWETNKREPSLSMLDCIATYFTVSTDYLLGRSETPQGAAQTDGVSEWEKTLILLYREQTDGVKEAVERLLCTEQSDRVPLYMAAHSTDGQGDRVIFMERSRWEALRHAKETDETLL